MTRSHIKKHKFKPSPWNPSNRNWNTGGDEDTVKNNRPRQFGSNNLVITEQCDLISTQRVNDSLVWYNTKHQWNTYSMNPLKLWPMQSIINVCFLLFLNIANYVSLFLNIPNTPNGNYFLIIILTVC